MTATAEVNGAWKPIGNEAAIQTGMQLPQPANSQIGRGQLCTASPSTGYAALNDGTVPNQIGVGFGYPGVKTHSDAIAGNSTVLLWQGESRGIPSSIATLDSFLANDIGVPWWIADENTPGKLSNRAGSNRSLGGVVLSLFNGMPNLLGGVVGWLIGRATLLVNAKLGAWVQIADAAASDAIAERAIVREKLHGLVTGIDFTGAAIAADNTDYITVTTSKRDGAGGAAVVMGTYDSRAANQGAVTAFVPAAFALSAVAGALNVLETDVVTITVVKGGAGKVITGAVRVTQKVQ